MGGEWNIKYVPIEECVEEIIDYRGKTPEKSKNGIPLITAKIIKNGRIDTPTEFIPEDQYESWMKRGIPKSGDVLITSEAPLGEIAQLNNAKVALAQRVIVLRGKSNLLDNTYLRYVLKSPSVMDEIQSRATGTTVLGIKQSELKKVKIPLPSLSKQKLIGKMLFALDERVDLNLKINNTLEEIARAIFKHWFIDFEFPNENGDPYKSSGGEMIDSPLGPIPKGWEVRRLIELSRFIGRGIAPKYDDEGEFVIINQRCIRDKTIDFRNSRRSSKGSSKDRRLQFGDMLINSTGVGTLGRVAQLREAINSCTVDSHVTIVRPIAELDTNYFGLAMENLEPYFEDLGIGTTGQTELGRVTIGETLFLFPKENIQKKFSRNVDSLRRASQRFQRTNDALAELRDSLLPKLMSGEIRVPVSDKEVDQF